MRTSKFSFILVFCFALLLSITASAQSKKKSSEPKETEYDFEADTIEGNTKSPEELFITGQQNSKLSNLITIREDFKKEIVKSAEGI